jgi:YD repeat-containing protein
MRGPALTTLLLLAAATPSGAQAGGGDVVIPPILGPEGPMWLGAVTPDDPRSKQQGREWIVVHPVTGALIVEALDVDDGGLVIRRRWDEAARRWGMSFDALPLGAPKVGALSLTYAEGQVSGLSASEGRFAKVLRGPDGFPAQLDLPGGQALYYDSIGGRLLAVSGSARPRTRYTYDAAGRLAGILWADGSSALVERDAAGRVIALLGPGPAQLLLSWRADGQLTARDAVGRVWVLREEAKGLVVTGPSGRVVQSQRDEFGRLTNFVDPRGATTSLRRDAEGQLIELQSPAGRWRLVWEARRLVALIDPSGGEWRGLRDLNGALTALIDPLGRRRELSTRPDGALESQKRGGETTRLVRDVNGRITRIETPGGPVVRLRWSEAGELVEVEDPAGGKISLSERRGGLPGLIRLRDGAELRLRFDTLGRVRAVESPEGARFDWIRDLSGRLTELRGPGGQRRTLRYRADGLISQIEDDDGAVWGLLYGLDGRLSAVRPPGQPPWRLGWDRLGELISVEVNGERSTIQRDERGHPSALGPLRWAWDALGRLISAEGPGLSLRLGRNSAGEVSQLSLGESAPIRVDRDGAGRVVSLDDGARALRLERDAGGRVIGLNGDGEALSVERDVRGLPVRQRIGDLDQRAARDAEGRVLRWTSATGLALSLDRDAAGRPLLVRFPDGVLDRRERAPGYAAAILEAADGDVIDDLELSLSAAGQVLSARRGGGEERWAFDALGRPTALTEPAGAWIWRLDELTGPDGERALYTPDGRPSAAVPPLGVVAWGLGEDRLDYSLNEAGQVTALRGERGRVSLEYDELGRPVRGAGQGPLALVWDLLGRPTRVQAPDGDSRLSWGLDRPLRVIVDGKSTEILGDLSAGLALGGATRVNVAVGERGSPRALTDKGELLRLLRYNPLGAALGEAPPWPGWRGLWTPSAEAPTLDGAGAWDPYSGQPLSPRWRPPWAHGPPSPAPWPEIDGVASPWWEPAPYAPESVWADPLALLRALGELGELFDAPSVALRPAAPPAGWLGPSAATPEDPWGQHPEGLPIHLDPLSLLALQAAMPPSTPLRAEDVLRALLHQELAGQPALTWVPGWTPRGALSQVVP